MCRVYSPVVPTRDNAGLTVFRVGKKYQEAGTPHESCAGIHHAAQKARQRQQKCDERDDGRQEEKATRDNSIHKLLRLRLKCWCPQRADFLVSRTAHGAWPGKRLGFESRSTASIMARGLAMPLPEMSWALPCATDENRIGVPMVSAAPALGASSF